MTTKAKKVARTERRERRNKRNSIAVEVTKQLLLKSKPDPRLLAAFKKLLSDTAIRDLEDPRDHRVPTSKPAAKQARKAGAK